MDSLVALWQIDRIDCASWFKAGDRAFIFGSNWAFDTCSFELFRLEDGETSLINFQFSMVSPDWWESTRPEDIESTLSQDAIKRLNGWEREIQKIISWLPSGQWRRGPGNGFDLEYAVLAFLHETLGEFGGGKSNETIANLLSIPISTSIERVRESRSRGLLSGPGKGIRGQSKMTAKAKKLLEAKGVISA